MVNEPQAMVGNGKKIKQCQFSQIIFPLRVLPHRNLNFEALVTPKAFLKDKQTTEYTLFAKNANSYTLKYNTVKVQN